METDGQGAKPKAKSSRSTPKSSPKSSPRTTRAPVPKVGAKPIKASRPVRQDLSDPDHFVNRELSLLEFNRRVLEVASDPETPLLERLRFLCICTTNLDEFFEIRVSGLKQQASLGLMQPGPDGLSPMEALNRISIGAHGLVAAQYELLNQELLPALRKEGIRVLRRSKWPTKVQRWVREYFQSEVLPVLTPMGLDPAHPFPNVLNKSLSFILALEGKDAFGRSSRHAVLQVPRTLPRLIPVPSDVSGESGTNLLLLSSIIHAHAGQLFPGMKVTGCYQFRVTRNRDLWIDEEEIDDLLHALAGELPRREYGAAVRLEVAAETPEELTDFLLEQFRLGEDDLYRVKGPVNLYRFAAIYKLAGRPDLQYPPFVPSVPESLRGASDIFTVLRKKDIVLHHPYESFAPVLEMIRTAGKDPSVLAIKMTLYRTGVDSPIVDALIDAATAGKEVTVVVELRARFDEEANIDLATRLQNAGANVAYGVVGYKAHAKLLMIVRREGTHLVRYAHLGTGNYHTGTTRAYTDLSFLTSDTEIVDDVHKVFMQLTSLGKVTRLKKLVQSPFTLHKTVIKHIQAETKAAQAGKPARIMAKMNQLSERQVIEALYEASRAGVKIDLIVRGVCCLRPGIKGVSDNIRVRSIVGRFLEHSRVFYFYAGGAEVLYCGSADWMPRNLFRRVEVVFPVEKTAIRKRIVQETLLSGLEDNLQAWEMKSDGTYERVSPGKRAPVASQTLLLDALADSEQV